MEENKELKEELEEVVVPDKPDYSEEILEIIRTSSKDELKDKLSDYHDSDIADAIPLTTKEERQKLFDVLGVDAVSDIFAYLDDVEDYVQELGNEEAANVIESMDADDAIDVLDELPEEQRQKIINLMEGDVKEDVKLIDSYDDDVIGSKMTTNFVTIEKSFTIKEAMKAVVTQAADNDNISTIYVLEKDKTFYGAVDLKDLIVAREKTPLEDIITTNYPYVYANEQISDCIEELKDYSEDSIPVLNEDNLLIGVITSTDIVEAVDEEFGDDYAKFAGLTSEEDFDEPLRKSIAKRIPWLFVLLALGLLVSSIIQLFQKNIPTGLIILYTFQSLILDMSGNTGTQSLGVTIRILSNEELTKKEKWKFVLKELKVGFTNGLIIGSLAFIVIGIYLTFIVKYSINGFLISGCIGVSLLCAMIIASLDGTLIPMLFKKLKIDPAVASGPLITTVNDFVAVCAYYGISILLLVNVLSLA